MRFLFRVFSGVKRNGGLILWWSGLFRKSG